MGHRGVRTCGCSPRSCFFLFLLGWICVASLGGVGILALYFAPSSVDTACPFDPLSEHYQSPEELFAAYYEFHSCARASYTSPVVIFHARNGLGNRLIGLASTFVYSVYAKRVFFIVWPALESECNAEWEDLFVPPPFDCLVDDSTWSWSDTSEDKQFIGSRDYRSNPQRLESFTTYNNFWDAVVENPFNKPTENILAKFSSDERFMHVLRQFTAPTAVNDEAVRSLLSNMNISPFDRIVGVMVRAQFEYYSKVALEPSRFAQAAMSFARILSVPQPLGAHNETHRKMPSQLQETGSMHNIHIVVTADLESFARRVAGGLPGNDTHPFPFRPDLKRPAIPLYTHVLPSRGPEGRGTVAGMQDAWRTMLVLNHAQVLVGSPTSTYGRCTRHLSYFDTSTLRNPRLTSLPRAHECDVDSDRHSYTHPECPPINITTCAMVRCYV